MQEIDPWLPGCLDITMAASEIVPFAKTGGLADVVGALSNTLANAGVKVNMVIPAYRPILLKYIDGRIPDRSIQIDIAGRVVKGGLFRESLSPLLDVYFVRADEYFDREGYYGDVSGDFPDNSERFAFFSRAVLEVARLNRSQVLHLHDWQASPAAAFLRLQSERYPELAQTKIVTTIHNLAYQGLFPCDHFPALDLDIFHFNLCQFEFYGMVNYLKAGLVNADRITTVSPTYACEIQQNGCGFGLEGVLRERAKDLSGILNGVEYTIWNPETDSLIAERYSRQKMDGKAFCKRALQNSYGLQQKPEIPLFCMVTRLTDGKGLELVTDILDDLLKIGAQFVILGSGDKYYEEFFLNLPSRYPGQAGVKIVFDEAVAHQTIAGADMLLMPSLREPCGLTQMYALRYGTVPIVRRTGGLADTVDQYDPMLDAGNGFLFDDYRGAEFLSAIQRALDVYQCGTNWHDLILRGMSIDNSWQSSMEIYLQLYGEMMG
ncbi:glycogen synthase GlgA [Dehalogenimonas sp. THU2]|uniref:glycogen synthase GlgA n=1 Tax=Dehalogenimonas sp. THU2 TaxID=3151121 RepID=UPI003218A9A7